MERKDVKCPLCGDINSGVDIDETDGWVECEQCGGDFAPGECLDRVIQSTYSVLHLVGRIGGSIEDRKGHPIS